MLARIFLIIFVFSTNAHALDPDINFDRIKDMKDALIHLQTLAELRDPAKVYFDLNSYITIESTLADVMYCLKICSGWIDTANMVKDGYLKLSSIRAGTGWNVTAKLYDNAGQPVSYTGVNHDADTYVYSGIPYDQIDVVRQKILSDLAGLGKQFVALGK